ncbi:hypothetical protein [Crocinitomix catalasitica]|uniref:hypothetical protein n=1 Tax=Crocinitomix catalasitica TaxID=184607 RepID=UPI0009077369|nr:hypothetical protein [Crocinitomix catalasitica]
MRLLFIILSFILLFICLSSTALAQGCVAVRSMSCSAGTHGSELGILNKNDWQLSGNYQYFESYRHFRGDVEEKERVAHHTQVFNFSNSVDLGIRTAPTNRINLTLNIPILFFKRSSLYEHYGNSSVSNPEQKRFETDAQGIGDIRLTANYWLFNPANTKAKGNVSIGGGIKIPTGNSNFQGEFHKLDQNGNDSIAYKAVDQSIQLGDGGWGIILQTEFIGKLNKKTTFFGNAFYLSNPMATNKTMTRGSILGVDPLISHHSIPDQYSIRFGVNYVFYEKLGLSFNLGNRFEGVTSKDLIGSSIGYRRPGYIYSIEPGISYNKNLWSFNLSVPVAIYRNRIKSQYDLADPTGQRHGDAAFADYLINFTFVYKIEKMSTNHNFMVTDIE